MKHSLSRLAQSLFSRQSKDAPNYRKDQELKNTFIAILLSLLAPNFAIAGVDVRPPMPGDRVPDKLGALLRGWKLDGEALIGDRRGTFVAVFRRGDNIVLGIHKCPRSSSNQEAYTRCSPITHTVRIHVKQTEFESDGCDLKGLTAAYALADARTQRVRIFLFANDKFITLNKRLDGLPDECSFQAAYEDPAWEKMQRDNNR